MHRNNYPWKPRDHQRSSEGGPRGANLYRTHPYHGRERPFFGRQKFHYHSHHHSESNSYNDTVRAFEIEENWEEEEETVQVQQNPTVSFTQIPHPAGEVLCEHLDRSTLLSLRLVCHKTKGWVESPRILLKIPIEVKISKQLQCVVNKSNVQWNNFSFLSHDLAQQSYLRLFIPKYCEQIRVLKILSLGGYDQKRDLILASPKLEVLILSGLRLGSLSPEQVEQLIHNCSNLRELKIQEITDAKEEDIEIFSRMATASNRLSLLKIPGFQWQRNIVEHSEKLEARQTRNNQNLEKVLVHNLIKFLKIRASAKPLGMGNLKEIDIGHAFSYGRMESKYFQELAATCGETGTRLVNVSNFNIIPSSVNAIGVNVYSAIGSLNLAGLSQPLLHILSLDSLPNLNELKLTISLIVDAQDEPLDSNIIELVLPHLKTLDVTLFCKLEEHTQEIMKILFVKTVRASVTGLKVAWNFDYDRPYNFIEASDLVRNFPNIETLHLYQYSGGDAEFKILFQGMSKLQDLRIKDCRNLTDESFIGLLPQQLPSPFIQLQNLRTLWIRSFASRVTDKSFMHAFWKLPLRHLTFNTVGAQVITLDGISSLQRHPFGKTIQYLDVTRPEKVPDWKIRNTLSQLPNLKRASV